jgi:hypothetical protein
MEIFSAISSFLPLIQYPAMILTCVGYTFLTSKRDHLRKTGFTISAIGNIVWMIYGILTTQPAIIGTNVFIFAFGVRGYINHS